MIETGKILQQRYRIDKQIGQGGMGAVYVATDERFGSTVAIKETLCMDDNYRKAIEREARLLNRLKHSALPRVSDHFLEENGQFLVMEYIAGEDLGWIMEDRERPFPVETVLDWADQLLDALDFLHNQVNPVIHRDIKPQNLKVTPGGQIVLLDFGLAKGHTPEAGNLTGAKSIFGYSRNYASLEQIQGTGTDPRSDLYSLAATLYHLLTGAPPEDALTRAMAVLSNQPDPLTPANVMEPSIPAGVAGILQNAMDLNASARPSSAAEMRTMFRGYDQYAGFVTESSARPRVDTGIFTQKTRLMPGATRQEPDRQTDIKTELLPSQLSQVTAVAAKRSEETNDTSAASPVSKRRYGSRPFLTAAIALCSVIFVGAGIYVFKNVKPHPASREEEQKVSNVSNAESAPAAPVAAPESLSLPAGDTVETSVATNTARAAAPASKRAAAKPQPGKKKNDREKDITIDGTSVNVGDIAIKEGLIRMPDVIISPEGLPKPPIAVPPFYRRLTPEQRRRLRILRESKTRPRVPPTPSP